jgi:heme/copper-type cytochrome/quinol oxidase subunit 2
MVAMIIAMIVTTVIVMTVIIVLICTGRQQRSGTEHQNAQAGNQTLRHFHQVFPHDTRNKKGFRTRF